MGDVVNSHIQIPKSLLAGFSQKEKIQSEKGVEKKDLIYRMNMDLTIDRLDIQDCNVEAFYFSDSTETILGKYEKDFGEIKKTVGQFQKKKQQDMQLTPQQQLQIIDFFCISYLRAPWFTNSVNEKSYFSTRFGLDSKDVLIEMFNEWSSTRDLLFKGCKPNILINMTSENFIVTQSVLYPYLVNGQDHYIIPVNEKCAITMVPDISKYVIDGYLYYQKIENPEQVDTLNKYALDIEFGLNQKAVYAKRRADLEKYIPYIKETLLSNL